ncbi:MAG: HAD family hydrolase [Christensenellales bacterium]|jgi:phosphoglycolate phosphatase
MYDCILFDLDGTLTDPKPGITGSAAYALAHFGIREENMDELERFIGPPLKESFMKYYGLTEDQAETAIEKYREVFSVTGLYENKVYPGIPQALERLRKAGKRLGVATSKPEIYSRRILEHFELDGYFEALTGSELDGSRVDKEEVIREALLRLSADPRRTLMVGDRLHDIEGAKKAGVASLGVSYGYGGRAELLSAGADRVEDTVEGMADWILAH